MSQMSGKKDAKSPATTSFAYDAMEEVWEMVETLLGGTRTMRSAGREYLPQHDEESDVNYDDRLHSNVLFNVLELTLDHFVGRPFSDPVSLNDDVPETIREMAKNIDLQGNDITTLCRQWFREGLAKGFAHILVDMPSLDMEERQGRTLADDRQDGRRPYWLFIKPDNVIFATSEIVGTPDGPREHLTHVRIKEIVTEREGFAEVEKEHIRVLEPGLWLLYEKRQVKRRKPEWVLIDNGTTDLDVIPMVTFYAANREGLMQAKPPLEDLAHLNIRWWQSNADQINVLTVARFPMLAVAGATDASGTTMRIGPRQLLGTKDANGKFYYVEHTGKSINAGRQDLLDLEEQMANYGSIFMKRRPGNQVATARALDSAESTSPLQDMTVRFIDSVNTALKLTAEWMKVEDGGTVKIATDFGPEEESTADLEFLLDLRKARDISREALLDEAKRRGIIADDFDSVVDLEQLYVELEALKPLEPLVPGTFDVQNPPQPDPAVVAKLRSQVEARKEALGRPSGDRAFAPRSVVTNPENDD